MKIACLNTGHTDWGYDLRTWGQRAKRLASYVVENNADIIALQEIFLIKYSEADDALKSYLSHLGLPPDDFDKLGILMSSLPKDFKAYPSLIPSQDRGVVQPGLYWGLGLVSRIPLEETRTLQLTYSKFDRWPRIVLAGRGTGMTGAIFNVHFSAESLAARQRGVLEALEFMQKFGEPGSVFFGDFNDTPAGSPAQQMRARLLDMWESVETSAKILVDDKPISPLSSLARILGESRIDHGFVERSLKTLSLKYFFETGDPPLSDHPLIIAELGPQ